MKTLLLCAVGIACSVSAASAESLIIGDYWGSKAYRFASDGTNLGTYCSSGGTSRFYGLCFDLSGYGYVAGEFSRNVRRFAPTGADLGDFATTSFDTESVALDQNGNLYVAGNGSVVEKFAPNGTDLGAFAPTGGIDGQAICFGHDGNLYVTSGPSANGTIHRFSPTGADLGVFATGVDGGEGMVIDGTGQLFVAERGSYGDHLHDIHRFSSTGVDLGRFGAPALSDPAELALSSGGDLYVSDFGSGAIHRFSATGTDLGTFASGLPPTSGIAFQPDAVPEPNTVAAIAVGSFVLLRRRRR